MLTLRTPAIKGFRTLRVKAPHGKQRRGGHKRHKKRNLQGPGSRTGARRVHASSMQQPKSALEERPQELKKLRTVSRIRISYRERFR